MKPINKVEILLFTVEQQKLNLLLIPILDHFGLPSGEVGEDEDMDKAALRVMNQYVHSSAQVYFRQMYTLGKADRFEDNRVISTSYLALIPSESIEGTRLGQWFTISKKGTSLTETERKSEMRICNSDYQMIYQIIDTVENNYISKDSQLLSGSNCQLAYDHIKPVNMAMDRLQHGIASSGLLFSLLPETFTLKEIQQVYEAVMDKQVDTPNFRRDIVKMLIPTGIMKKINRKKAMSYRFNPLFQYLREDL